MYVVTYGKSGYARFSMTVVNFEQLHTADGTTGKLGCQSETNSFRHYIGHKFNFNSQRKVSKDAKRKQALNGNTFIRVIAMRKKIHDHA